jgi:hypothetical protein
VNGSAATRRQLVWHCCMTGLLIRTRQAFPKYAFRREFHSLHKTPNITYVACSWALLRRPPFVQLIKNIPSILRYPAVRYRVHNSPLLVPILSQINPVRTGAATFLSSSSAFILTRAEWTPFQTYCYSENLVAPGIDPGTSRLAARNSDH